MSSEPGRIRRVAASAVREVIGRRRGLRGAVPPADGRLSLLVVNWRSLDDTTRLIKSFRRFVGDQPVVFVDNSPTRSARARCRDLDARYVTAGVNIGHGLGIDLGMRVVHTEFTLVCDPDTVIVSTDFAPQIEKRLRVHRVAAADTGNPFYHPLCVAFPTELWKLAGFSFEQRWPFWDVGGELTRLVGGVEPGALLPKTRQFGEPLVSAAGGDGLHYLGEVYGEVFSSTYLGARLVAEPDRDDFEGWSRSTVTAFHRAWRAWADDVVAGRASVSEFPSQLAT
jgi:hypothetical protein